MMGGPQAGRWLWVDLSEGVVEERALAEAEVRQWLLGSGMAANLFDQGLEPGRDPLDPKSPLLIFNGLLTGTFAPAAARTSWCGRSPLTGIWNESNVGGHWGAQLRFAGYDGLVITGRAPSPVYLWIDDGQVEVRDAAHLWGLGTFETHDRLRKETDPEAQVACIGPAGENRVRLAGVMVGGRAHNRAAGRGGMGAVMGSKNLKAVVVRGRRDRKAATQSRPSLNAVVRDLNRYIRSRSEGMSLTGTAGGIPAAEHFGGMPLKNWQEGSWPEGARAISGQTIRETIWVRDTFCHACPVGCGKAVRLFSGPYAGEVLEGPEYETLCGFGGNLLIDDLEALATLNARCNDLGLDTISTSGVIGFAAEAVERGLISAEEAEGLTWGDPRPVLTLLDRIAHREGLGDLLAEGVRLAAQRLGPEAERFALHVKGLEPAYHDPRAFVDMGLNYATASRGACHLESATYWRGYGIEWPGWQEGPRDRFASDEETVRLVIAFQDFLAVFNPLGICKFMVKGGMDPERTAQLVSAATGWDWSADDVMDTGRRIFDLKRQINERLGITRADDTLPYRFLHEPRPSGTAAGVLPDLEAMLPLYYELRGWR